MGSITYGTPLMNPKDITLYSSIYVGYLNETNTQKAGWLAWENRKLACNVEFLLGNMKVLEVDSSGPHDNVNVFQCNKTVHLK